MKEGDTISEYFARVMVVVIMRNLGEEMSDAKRVEMIVRTLVEEFTFVVCGIEESNVIKDHAVKVEGRWNSSGGREAKGEEDTKWSAGYVFDEKKKWSWENDQQENGGDGGASGEDGEALETGKERGGCHDLSNDAESAKVCVKFAEACKEEEWLEAMRCELQAIHKKETWDLASSQVDVKKMEAKWCELQVIEKNQIGSLMPHMMYVADLISQFMAKSKEEHMLAAKSVLTYLKRTVDSRRAQHIDVRYHYLCDLAKQEVVKLVFCGTEDQVADIMTKPVKLEAFIKLREKLGVCNRVN